MIESRHRRCCGGGPVHYSAGYTYAQAVSAVHCTAQRTSVAFHHFDRLDRGVGGEVWNDLTGRQNQPSCLGLEALDKPLWLCSSIADKNLLSDYDKGACLLLIFNAIAVNTSPAPRGLR